jgi:hypothetical protein
MTLPEQLFAPSHSTRVRASYPHARRALCPKAPRPTTSTFGSCPRSPQPLVRLLEDLYLLEAINPKGQTLSQAGRRLCPNDTFRAERRHR